MLSLYYIFIWDPTIRPFVTKANQCGKSKKIQKTKNSLESAVWNFHSVTFRNYTEKKEEIFAIKSIESGKVFTKKLLLEGLFISVDILSIEVFVRELFLNKIS